MRTLFVTGGAGFIGSNFVLDLMEQGKNRLLVFDKLTYAGRLSNLSSLINHPLLTFIQGDILDRPLLKQCFDKEKPEAIVHFAAETHVDRSIQDGAPFVKTNVEGTFHLLQEAYLYWKRLSPLEKNKFRFLHISTDEVYGSLSFTSPKATETSPYKPTSPYAASKAASDHFVYSFFKTYGFPTLITHCSNNFGPFQFPEKLIPLMILNILQKKPLPIYGNGENRRNWLYVKDHCKALNLILEKAPPGEEYVIGSQDEMSNLQLVKTLLQIMDAPSSEIVFVPDRPGHDLRYALNSNKLETTLGWKPSHSFEEGLKKTVDWYVSHPSWLKGAMTKETQHWMDQHYGELSKR